jgi:UDP-N-acetylglucosamine 4,6-dehydratase/5-epimerase
MFNNKIIMITGGTGSFGNKFIDIFSKKYSPKKIIIFSRDEYKQDLMQKKYDPIKYPYLRFLIGDVRDYERLKIAMRDVDYVVHAAALKQVPAAEYNPMEFVKTNIHGAENIINAALACDVKKVIALSTDKAANPINLYGATKLASDKIFIAANNITGTKNNIFSVVRYGNVIGSRGSVVPLFYDLIKNKSIYLPITDVKMTRFWLSLEDSVNFVISSFEKMMGGEVFVPKIPSVKITDLAKAMNNKAKFKIIGIRPGEKIHELMCPKESSNHTLEFKNYYIIFSSDVKLEKKINLYYKKNKEKGVRVKNNFEYSSDTNKNFLNISQIKKLNLDLKF